jgi:hypothetical protein
VIVGSFFILLLLLVPALGIWAAVDAGTKPTWAFERVGQSKTLWVVLPLVGFFLCGIVTVVAAIVWFASIRPRVVAAAFAAPALPPATSGWNPPLPPQDNRVPAQWNPDPLGRHELRYWNGAEWTEHVSDGGVASTDPVGPAT